MIKEKMDKKTIRNFLLQGNNDIEGHAPKNKLNPQRLQEKVTHALLNGSENKVNRYTRYLEAALSSIMSNEENKVRKKYKGNRIYA